MEVIVHQATGMHLPFGLGTDFAFSGLLGSAFSAYDPL
jgi:hypothetical protein